MSQSPTSKTRHQIQLYLQHRINHLRADLVSSEPPAQMLLDRDLCLYETADYMHRENVQQVEDIVTHVRIENLARYCVEKQQYFSSMEDFFLASNSFYARLVQALKEQA